MVCLVELDAKAAEEQLDLRPYRLDIFGGLDVKRNVQWVGSGAGYFLWLWALRHAPATEVTVFLALSPLTATGLGAMWLGEAVSVLALFGLGAVVGGLWLATREPRGGLEHQINRREV